MGYADFIKKLHDDSAFRHSFAADPAGVLRAHGLDPELLDLPQKIDADTLDRRIEAGISNALPDSTTLRQASAQELWDTFSFIRVSTLLPLIPTLTGVIYGTTATATVAIATVGSIAHAEADLARLGRLRDLARLPAAELRFTVSAPDGRAVHDLDFRSIRALIGR